MDQLKLPLNKPPISTGKKTQRITFTCTDKFKEFVNFVANHLLDSNESELGQRYFLEGLTRDIGQFFLAEPNLEKTLREILQKENQNSQVNNGK